VQSWREAGQLPFPQMSGSRREQIADTLDYPPRGSPDAFDSQSLKSEVAEPLSTDEGSNDQPSETDGPKTQ
jgi:hypothetical protein